MSDNIHSQREWYKISEVEFGFLKPSYLRRISVCEISNPQVYDTDKKPNRNSLYDPLLGVSPNDRETTCETCGHVGLDCSGHPGHIELITPVYNPLVIDVLLRILKMTCLSCYRFRIRHRIKEDYAVMLQLLQKDKIAYAYQYYDLNLEEETRRLQRLENGNEGEKATVYHQERVSKCQKRIALAEEIKKQAREMTHTMATSTSIQLFTEFLKLFNSLAQVKCSYGNCKKYAKRVKKEGANKIFLITREKRGKSKYPIRNKSRDSNSKGYSTNMYSTPKVKQQYLNPKYVYSILRKIWTNYKDLVEVIFGNWQNQNSFTMFFLNTVFVPPSRFRPESKMGEYRYLHDHTSILAKTVQSNTDIKHMIINEHNNMLPIANRVKAGDVKFIDIRTIKAYKWYSETIKNLSSKADFINKWLELQDAVNCFIDSSKSSKISNRDSKGVRQILYRKEGLFRMKMMGKRVNYAARSVISPDPSLNTDEVGIPMFMSKKLTFPYHVNEYDLYQLQSYVINGKKYPGANFLEYNGKMIKLDCLTEGQRISHARNLWNNHYNKIVYRHLKTGDNVLFNRQPTLHKASLMAHRIKVLPKYSTLRMNYANCKSYNADFDGDYMNLHALQNYMSKAYAYLCISDKLYENPTNGKPLREIMQDAIISAVYLTMRDTFFDKCEYSGLLYQATCSLFEERPKNVRIFLLRPAISRPLLRWTGKQLISNVIQIVVSLSGLKFATGKGMTMRSMAKVPKSYLKGYYEYAYVVVINNELLKGIIDKNQVGSNSYFGLLHSFTELYGYSLTGKLMTALNKLFLAYMQIHGFTCGLDDLVLKKKANKVRRKMLDSVHYYTVSEICTMYGANVPTGVSYFGRSEYKCDEIGNPIKYSSTSHLHLGYYILRFLYCKLTTDKHAGDYLDAEYQHHLSKKSSTVIELALTSFIKRFPANNFSMMTITGAKGSNVNHSAVAVMLGQQYLEGKRVPIMITGKTLPSFRAYDPNPRASGFIADRFLTGLRYQYFYFHCMAGRYGLIDTAVKTSRSGYLQRCLMKHLESLKVGYDLTVRDSDSSIIEFLAGYDSLNPAKYKFFTRLDFLSENIYTFKMKYKHKEFQSMMITDDICRFKKYQYTIVNNKTTILDVFPPCTNLGVMSEKCYKKLSETNASLELMEVFGLKYKFGMVEPGESVGCAAAQSIGEPSTQMTLNTFHLAGHGGANLTLGIPRLRELLMTSTDKIKTPIMYLRFKTKTSREQAVAYSKKMQKVNLLQLISNIEVVESKKLVTGQSNSCLLLPNLRKRFYRIVLNYELYDNIKKEYGIDSASIENKIKVIVIPQLLSYITRVKKRNELKVYIKRSTREKYEDPEEYEYIEPYYDDLYPYKYLNVQYERNEEKEDKEKYPYEYKPSYCSYPEFDSVKFDVGRCYINIKVDLSLKKFLMTKVLEKILMNAIIKETVGIASVRVLEERYGAHYLQTYGVNFRAIEQFEFVDQKTVRSNDVQAVAKKFGVIHVLIYIEAARTVLVKYIVDLFKGYGVSVDYRHLYLISDYVTFGGNIRAMNRNWMSYNVSPFLRMTFETSVKFITEAAMRCSVDSCRTPSSRIIIGQCPEVGTGVCELLMDTGL